MERTIWVHINQKTRRGDNIFPAMCYEDRGKHHD